MRKKSFILKWVILFELLLCVLLVVPTDWLNQQYGDSQIEAAKDNFIKLEHEAKVNRY